MKLHKLRLSNLNSLQGTWEIDFASPALLDEGLFLISGPTGAGKSTILDAICLALYGQTPRLGKIGEGGNEIMSRSSGECLAQISFSVSNDGEVYVASWSQSRARRKASGKLQSVHREISKASDGKILAQSIKEADSLVAELTGLRFEQFKRSILLAQGDFAAFLESDTKERAAILEKITGTEIYRQLSILCFERHKQEQTALELLQKEQQLRLPLSTAERQDLEQQLEQATVSLQNAEAILTELQEAYHYYREQAQLWQEGGDLWQKGLAQFGIGPQTEQAQCKLRWELSRTAYKLKPLYQAQRQQAELCEGKLCEITNNQQLGEQLALALASSQQDLAEFHQHFVAWDEFQQYFSQRHSDLQQQEWQSSSAKEKLKERLCEQQSCQQLLDKAQANQAAVLRDCQVQIQKMTQLRCGEPDRMLGWQSFLPQELPELKNLPSPNTSTALGSELSVAPEIIASIAPVMAKWQQHLDQLKHMESWLCDNSENSEANDWQRQYQSLSQQLEQAEAQLLCEEQRNYDQEIATLQESMQQQREPQLEMPAAPAWLELEGQSETLSEQQQEEVLQQALKCLNLLISPLERYLLECEQHGRAAEQSTQTHKAVLMLEAQLTKVETDLQRQQDKYQRQQRYCKTLEEKLELEQRLLVLAQERDHLTDGQPCPLCGSTEHSLEQVVQPSSDTLATQSEFDQQLQELQELQNAVSGDKEEAEKLRLQLEDKRQSLRKQQTQTSCLQDELQTQQQRLLQILQNYPTPQSLLPMLWQQIQSTQPVQEPESWTATATALRCELADRQQQLDDYRSAEDLATNQWQLAKNQWGQLQQQQYEQLQQLHSQQQQSDLHCENARSESAHCQAMLQNFGQRLRKDFGRCFQTYKTQTQWRNSLNPELTMRMAGQKGPQLNSPEAKMLEDRLLAALDGLEGGSATSDPLPLNEATQTEIKDLLYLAGKSQRNVLGELLRAQQATIQQMLALWQQWCEQQMTLPLLQERLQAAKQQCEQATAALQAAIQDHDEAEQQLELLQEQFQLQVAQLLERLPYLPKLVGLAQFPALKEELNPKIETQNGSPKPRVELAQLQQSIAVRWQAVQQREKQLQLQVAEAEQQTAWQQKELARLIGEAEAAQQILAQVRTEWQQALVAAGFADELGFLSAELEAAAADELEQQMADWQLQLQQWQSRWRKTIELLQKSREPQELGRRESRLEHIAAEPNLRQWDQQLQQFSGKLLQYWQDTVGPIAKLVAGRFDLPTSAQVKPETLETNPELSDAENPLQDILQLLEHLVAGLITRFQQTKEASQAASETLGALKKSRNDDDKLLNEQQQNAAKLQSQRLATQQWAQLNELIGSAGGDKFNRFAQQLSFEQLLYHANLYLEKISDRYLLRSLSESPLEFFVLDLYQQQEQGLRPSSNLSGGEKFLVSLALALALAKISANKVPVQSLFLDEGFGTLDEETLHSTLEVLSSLRSDGKLIGLISHVPALQERIICRIELESRGQGHSTMHCQAIPSIVRQLNPKGLVSIPLTETNNLAEATSNQNRHGEGPKTSERPSVVTANSSQSLAQATQLDADLPETHSGELF